MILRSGVAFAIAVLLLTAVPASAQADLGCYSEITDIMMNMGNNICEYPMESFEVEGTYYNYGYRKASLFRDFVEVTSTGAGVVLQQMRSFGEIAIPVRDPVYATWFCRRGLAVGYDANGYVYSVQFYSGESKPQGLVSMPVTELYVTRYKSDACTYTGSMYFSRMYYATSN